MKIEINNLTKEKISLGFLNRVAEKVVKFVKIKISEISVVLVGDAQIKKLNKQYRKINCVTDVLAFDYGEIFICLPQAERQAKQLGHSLKKELAILLIHGILHLAGYDDEKKLDYNKMVRKQEELWQKIIQLLV